MSEQPPTVPNTGANDGPIYQGMEEWQAAREEQRQQQSQQPESAPLSPSAQNPIYDQVEADWMRRSARGEAVHNGNRAPVHVEITEMHRRPRGGEQNTEQQAWAAEQRRQEAQEAVDIAAASANPIYARMQAERQNPEAELRRQETQEAADMARDQGGHGQRASSREAGQQVSDFDPDTLFDGLANNDPRARQLAAEIFSNPGDPRARQYYERLGMRQATERAHGQRSPVHVEITEMHRAARGGERGAEQATDFDPAALARSLLDRDPRVAQDALRQLRAIEAEGGDRLRQYEAMLADPSQANRRQDPDRAAGTGREGADATPRNERQAGSEAVPALSERQRAIDEKLMDEADALMEAGDLEGAYRAIYVRGSDQLVDAIVPPEYQERFRDYTRYREAIPRTHTSGERTRADAPARTGEDVPRTPAEAAAIDANRRLMEVLRRSAGLENLETGTSLPAALTAAGWLARAGQPDQAAEVINLARREAGGDPLTEGERAQVIVDIITMHRARRAGGGEDDSTRGSDGIPDTESQQYKDAESEAWALHDEYEDAEIAMLDAMEDYAAHSARRRNGIWGRLDQGGRFARVVRAAFHPGVKLLSRKKTAQLDASEQHYRNTVSTLAKLSADPRFHGRVRAERNAVGELREARKKLDILSMEHGLEFTIRYLQGAQVVHRPDGNRPKNVLDRGRNGDVPTTKTKWDEHKMQFADTWRKSSTWGKVWRVGVPAAGAGALLAFATASAPLWAPAGLAAFGVGYAGRKIGHLEAHVVNRYAALTADERTRLTNAADSHRQAFEKGLKYTDSNGTEYRYEGVDLINGNPDDIDITRPARNLTEAEALSKFNRRNAAGRVGATAALAAGGIVHAATGGWQGLHGAKSGAGVKKVPSPAPKAPVNPGSTGGNVGVGANLHTGVAPWTDAHQGVIDHLVSPGHEMSSIRQAEVAWNATHHGANSGLYTGTDPDNPIFKIIKTASGGAQNLAQQNAFEKFYINGLQHGQFKG